MKKIQQKSKIVTFGSGPAKFNLVVGVHGNEQSPAKAAILLEKYLQKNKLTGNFRLIFANTSALQRNGRFMETDLNRCFPGKESGLYEEKLAYDLSFIIKNTPFNFDFHSTTFAVKTYGIISTYSEETRGIINYLDIPNYVFTDNNCLIKFASNGIGFEMGDDREKKTVFETFKLMKKILAYFNIIPTEKIKKITLERKVFLIYNALNKKDIRPLKNLRDFILVKRGQTIGLSPTNKKIIATDSFYPVWTNHPNIINMAKNIIIKN